MRRVSIVGSSGSGKSTVGKALAQRLGVAHVELDSIRHQAGWTELPDDEFIRRVEAASAGQAWVIDGNYSMAVRDGPVWRLADTVVWLDLPRRTVMRQVTARSAARVFRRQELWNGNRERLRNLLSWDPEESVIRWAWTRHASVRAVYEARLSESAGCPFDVVRLRSRREIDTWLSGVGQTPRG